MVVQRSLAALKSPKGLLSGSEQTKCNLMAPSIRQPLLSELKVWLKIPQKTEWREVDLKELFIN
jgi:hypothetical protein